MSKNYYISGSNNITCDVCSKKIKVEDSARRWDGFQVCKATCWEERQPQDFVRSRQDKISVPITRPIPTLVFTDITYIDTGNTTIPSGNNNGDL